MNRAVDCIDGMGMFTNLEDTSFITYIDKAKMSW